MESAFAPGHITGILEVPKLVDDPLHQGSLGAGFSITTGVTTEVLTKRDSSSSIRITINGSPTLSAKVSEVVARRMLQMIGSDHEILISHRVEIPIGAGYGSSGSAGLSLALALNESLKLGLTIEEAAQIAHIAEIESHTGLGTVIAELIGGPEIRTSPGAPGVGKLSRFNLGRKTLAGSICFGPMETKGVLSDRELVRKINSLAGSSLRKLIKEPSVDVFLDMAWRFSLSLGLMSDRLIRVMRHAESIGLHCGMALFGETLFSLVTEDGQTEFEKILNEHESYGTNPRIIFSPVDDHGARLL